MIFLALGLAVIGSSALGQGVPQLSSRPGAAYTMYLNFGGFNFTGTWGNTNRTPGNVPAYSVDSNTTSFTAEEIQNIRNVWARAAEKYVAFGINVTTVDPAIAAGQAASDFQRQAFYDKTARLIHTIIGGTNDWYGGAGGVSYVDVAKNSYDPNQHNGGAGAGWKTNWTFTGSGGTFGWANSLQFLGEATAHECGHAFGCSHQSDFTGNTKVNEYSSGNGTGSGSYAPTMGNSYNAQRGAWRQGDAGSTNNRRTQNDVHVIASNPGLNLIDDGIGHTFSTATPMAIVDNAVDSSLAKGYIRPLTENNPNPIGEENYTKDIFAFRSLGGNINLRLDNGSQYLTPGVADPGATLRSKLRIFDRFGNLMAMGTEHSSTMYSTYSANLAAGDYFAQVTSYGGFTYGGQYNNGSYFDMGSYFLSGSGSLTMVPEPATLAALGLGALALMRRRRRS